MKKLNQKTATTFPKEVDSNYFGLGGNCIFESQNKTYNNSSQKQKNKKLKK